MKLGHNILKGSGLILKKEKEFISKTKSCFVLCWPAFPRIFVASQIFVLLKKVGSLKLRVAVFADIFGSGFWRALIVEEGVVPVCRCLTPEGHQATRNLEKNQFQE